jgi:hypothetical protein
LTTLRLSVGYVLWAVGGCIGVAGALIWDLGNRMKARRR